MAKPGKGQHKPPQGKTKPSSDGKVGKRNHGKSKGNKYKGSKPKPKSKVVTVRPEVGGSSAVSANWKKLLKTQGTDVNDTKVVTKHRSTEKAILDRVVTKAAKRAKTSHKAEAWFEEDLDEDTKLAMAQTVSTNATTTSKPQPSSQQVLAGSPDKYLAMDCEMVGVGHDGTQDVLARCSIVNRDGDLVLDTFVAPKEKVVDYRTRVSGVRRTDLTNAPSFEQVQKKVAALIKNKVLVGHSIHHDLKVLMLPHPRYLIRDTAKYAPFKELMGTGKRAPSLRKLASKLLKRDIQGGEHSSVEDAVATMDLYKSVARAWEKELKERRYGKRKA